MIEPLSPPVLTLIAAVAKNRVIGHENTLPWQLPEDLRHFKTLTLGHPIIMGRKTWASIGRPLPGRTNIVITRDPGFTANGVMVVHSLQDAIDRATVGTDEIFIIGGAEIYRQALPLARRLQLTEIDRDYTGDTFFPEWDRLEWIETRRECHQSGDGSGYAFVTYERRV